MVCKKCGFGGLDSYVPGEGNKNADLAVIGESPGTLEGMYGTPFIGESGGLLNWLLRKVGVIKRESERSDIVWIDNAIRCVPSSDITVEHTKRCRPFFEKKLLEIKPKIIITLGSHATKSVLKNYSANITKIHSFWHYSKEFDCWVMPTFHPAQALRNWGVTSILLRDFEKVAEALKDGVPKQVLGKHYVTINTPKKVKRLFKILNSKKRVAFDLETTSTKYWEKSEDIIGASFSWGRGKAAWLPFMGKSRRKIWKKSEFRIIYKKLKDFLENRGIKKDGANIKFDINFCRSIGIKVLGVDWDIMQFHHLVDENTPANLTYLTSYYDLNFPLYADEITPYVQKHPIFAKSKTYEHIPEKIIAKYACADADATFRISKIQRKLADKRQKHIYYNLSVPLSKVTANMEYKGALIDVKRITELETKYEKIVMKKSADFSELCGVDSINVNSSPQMQKLLFETLKFEPITKTKAGNYSTGKDVIELIKRKIKGKKKLKILKYITEIRQMRKMKSTYLTGFKKIVDKDDRLHTTYLTTGTVTGRPASISPNLSNIPRDPIFRSLFIAGKRRRLVVADYSQIEDRMMAFYAGEKKLLKKYKDAKFDPHTLTSANVRHKKPEDVTKEERSFDKAVKFGMNYGRSKKSIAETYDLDIEEVHDFFVNYFETHKMIAKYRARNVKLSKRGFLDNANGRRRNFVAYGWLNSPEIETVRDLRESSGFSNWILDSIVSGMERQALNFPIQSVAFDNMIRAMYRITQELKKEKLSESFLVLTVYDMVAVDTSNEEKKRVKKIVKDCMPFTLRQKSLKMDVTFPIDLTIGKHWKQ